MTTDKTVKDVAKTFQESVNNTFQEGANNGIKWFQNANAAFIETQNKQITAVNDIYNKMFLSAQDDGKFNLDFGASGKTLMDTIQKYIEAVSNISKAAVKTITDLSKQSNADTISNDTKYVFDLYNKQIEELTKLNQQSFDTIVKQFDTSKSSFSPMSENLKKEVNKVLDSSKESIKEATNSYNNFAISYAEANKEVFDKFFNQLNNGITSNLKAWQNLMSVSIAN